jgi:hypothetical protein
MSICKSCKEPAGKPKAANDENLKTTLLGYSSAE